MAAVAQLCKSLGLVVITDVPGILDELNIRPDSGDYFVVRFNVSRHPEVLRSDPNSSGLAARAAALLPAVHCFPARLAGDAAF